MALQDLTPADLAAVVGNDNDGFGNGNGWWIILLFMFLGWGNGGWNNGGNGNTLYPWLNSSEAMMNGFANLQTALCGGFANAETAATARQMADMQQMFGLQTSMLQGFNSQQAQFAQCCCDNRLALANLGADLAREACADRAAVSDGVRDILANQNAGIQRILDKMCDQDLFAERRENDNLRQQINMLTLAASQTAQTAELIAALKTTTAAGA